MLYERAKYWWTVLSLAKFGKKIMSVCVAHYLRTSCFLYVFIIRFLKINISRSPGFPCYSNISPAKNTKPYFHLESFSTQFNTFYTWHASTKFKDII